MKRPGAAILGLVAGAALVGAGLHVGCGGGGPVCGNGVVETGESCDQGEKNGMAGVPCDGTCNSITIPHPQVQVSWSLLAVSGVPGYDGAACPDVGAIGAKLVLDGPSHLEETLPCLNYSKLYDAACTGALPDGGIDTCSTKLLAGDYTATITLVDANGVALTRTLKAGPVTANPGPVVDLVLDFEIPDFLTSYTGDFLIQSKWGAGGAYCAAATPPVTQEALFLYPAGTTKTLMNVMTDMSNTLDGAPGPCFSPTSRNFYEQAKAVPWGPYSLVVKGYNGTVEGYCTSQQVFVGPGQINQGWSVTVNPVTLDGGTASDGGVLSCP